MSQTQEFIFPLNVWDKIITNLTGSSWINLQRTCKFFYFKSNIICVKNLEIVPNDGNVKKRIKKPMMKNLKLTSDYKNGIKFFVYDKIHIRTRRPISSIFSRIMKCNLEELIVEYNNLTWNEYLFLVDGGRIKKLSLEGVNIKHSNGDSVLLEDIMSQIPEANDIYIFPCYATNETFSKMCLLPRKVKIDYLWLMDFDRNFKAFEVFDYCKVVLNQESSFAISFAAGIADDRNIHDFRMEFMQAAKRNEWKCKKPFVSAVLNFIVEKIHKTYPPNVPAMIPMTINRMILSNYK
uniref:Uncharacterized protein n=1 Tax=Panagrolaimus davidi TaxID=227884 RepID=A0A914NXQ3_9BILA